MKVSSPLTPLHKLTSRQIGEVIRRRVRGDSDEAWIAAVGSVERDVNALRHAYPSGEWRLILTSLLMELGALENLTAPSAAASTTRVA